MYCIYNESGKRAGEETSESPGRLPCSSPQSGWSRIQVDVLGT